MIDPTEMIEEPEKSGDWLDMIEDAERYFDGWQARADNIDKLYSSLERLSNSIRDRQFAIFWANIQVLRPAIYARAPVPVVTPKFMDRRPLYRTASEFLERNCVVSFDIADVNETMLALRDDLAIVGRGAAWVRYEDDGETERVCYEHVDRRDFLHDPVRSWKDVTWVARRGWLTKREMRKRFGDEAANDASYSTRPAHNQEHAGGTDHKDKAGVWEIWHKPTNEVVWVVDGVDHVLERGEPHLKLSGFFPCPKPAYATLQRRTLIPVPDVMYYKDQIDEINDLTNRIHMLGRALVLKGFYPGGGEIGDAIEAAMNLNADGKLMVPISSMAAFGNGGDVIVWLPIEQVANTILSCVELRKQLIQDVYEIVGLSDIMRGATDASETATAQTIKSQNGSYRVRDKQYELVRMARDLVRLGAEIICDKYERKTLADASQMDLPTNADVKKQVNGLKEQAKEELSGLGEKAQQMAQHAQASGQQVDPQQAQQQFQQAQQQIIEKYAGQINEASQQVTIDQVIEVLRDENTRPYVLDIETDSTVYPDEQAEKSARAEFMTAFAASTQALMPLMSLGSEGVAMAGAVFKFALAPYRVGRELEGLIDDFADKGPQIAERMAAQQSNGGDNAEMAQASLELAKAEGKKAEAAVMQVQANIQKTQQDITLKAAEAQARANEAQQKFALEVESTRGNIAETSARIEKIYAEISKMGVDANVQVRREDREDVKAVDDIRDKAHSRAMGMQDRQRQAMESYRADMRAERGEARADRAQEFSERETGDE